MPIGKVPIKDEPRGFKPFGRVISTHEYEATSGATIAEGDLVMMSPSGKVLQATAGATQLIGVSAQWKASAVTTVLLYDAPDQQYLVQEDGAGNTVLVTTHLGLMFDVLATANQTTLKKSQHEMKRGGGGAGVTQSVAGGNLQLLGIVSVTGANSLCRVVIAEHAWAKKLTGVI